MELVKSLEFVKEYGRRIDYLLIKNLFEDCSEVLLDELLKYQNSDGGFGHGLEPDAQLPHSSVLATDVAIQILEEIELDRKEDVIKEICAFYISKYNSELERFEFVPKEVDDFPRAVWWNYQDLASFGKFNPTPEVFAFLLKYRGYHEFDIERKIDKLVLEIKEFLPTNDQEHSLYSIISLYKQLDKVRKRLLEKVLMENIEKLMATTKDKWLEYTPEPYKLLDKSFPLFKKYSDVYELNLSFILEQMSDDGVWYPEWQWYQFDDLFESKIKYQWMGFITYKKLKVLKENNKIKQKSI